MEIFVKIFEILINIFEAFISTRFLLKFQGYNFTLTSAKLKFVYASLGYAALTTVLNYTVPYDGVLGFLYVAYFFVISLLLVESKISVKFFAALLDNLVAMAVATAFLGIMSVTFKDTLSEIIGAASWTRVASITLAQLIKMFIYDIILRAVGKSGLKLGKKGWTLVSSVLGISFVSIALVQTSAIITNSYSVLLFAAELCSMAVAAVCFYMTILLNKSQRESERLRLAAQQEEFRAQYAQNVKKQYEEISRVRHDMKQTHSVVMSLLMEAKADEAIEYMQRAARKISEFDVIIDVGNDFVNAILNAKLSEAKRVGIMVLCSADKNAAGIDEVDLCNLLGNLLDNAIEACEKCGGKQRIIEIKLRARDDKYILEVENTAPENALESNKLLATTKDDASRHGYGVKSIKSIAEKYNGIVDFSQDGERFRSTVVLSVGE
ncbi:MAG: GHKL domain-containing protein [Oscillospiraceae bacterium]|nr:GHKL domain-containing protein [Oscillospiraceae bacterium]